MKFSGSTHLLMFLSFGDFNVHHKDWLTYSSGTDGSSELCYNFSNDLSQTVNFPLASQTVILTVLIFWISFFLLTLVFVLQRFPSIEKSWSCCCISFNRLSIIFTTGSPVSRHCLWLWLSLCWSGWSSWSFEKCSMGGYLCEFCERVQVGIDIYISLIESIRSSLTHLYGFQLLALLP